MSDEKEHLQRQWAALSFGLAVLFDARNNLEVDVRYIKAPPHEQFAYRVPSFTPNDLHICALCRPDNEVSRLGLSPVAQIPILFLYHGHVCRAIPVFV